MKEKALSPNTILQHDCIAGMKSLPAGSIDLIFADPPFNIGYEYDVYQDKLETEHYLDWSREWISAAHHCLKETGGFWLAIGDEYAAELKIISQEIGFHSRSWVIWYYTFGVNCKRKFTRSHAHLFHFVKNAEDFTFRAEDRENRIPSARQLVYNDKRANPNGRLPDDTWIIPPVGVAEKLQVAGTRPVQNLLFPEELKEKETDSKENNSDLDCSSLPEMKKLSRPGDETQTWTLRPQDVEASFTESEDTWYFPRVAGTFKERAGFHGCQMPEQLLGRIIRCCSSPGEIVLDPFSGSATTLAVAKKLGRQFLGYDISEEYIQYGQERLAGIHVGDRLNGSPEPLMSAPKTGEDPNAKTTAKSKKRTKKGMPFWNNPEEKERYYEQAQLELTYRGVRQAFLETHQQSSVDRVVADPDRNKEFIAACKKLGLAGETCSWNIMLFHLQKAGRLNEIEMVSEPAFSWSQCDRFLAASEIAMQSLITQKEANNLEEIFCDPILAKKFDELAVELSPGFSPFEYRWAALELRERSAVARGQGNILYNARGAQLERILGKKVPLEKLKATIDSDIPKQPGVYVIVGKNKEVLYVGETSDLRQRFQAQLPSFELPYWQKIAPQVSFRYSVVETDSVGKLAWQCCLAKKYKPRLNYHEFCP